MKITPELLRECADKYRKNGTYSVVCVEHDLGAEYRHAERLANVLEGIAGSIEEHYVDKDDSDAYQRGYDEGFASADDYLTDDVIAEHGLIRLPVDKDGVLIDLGDTVSYTEERGEGRVVGITFYEDKRVICAVVFRKGVQDLPAEVFTHECPDSWERIIRDATTAGCAYLGDTEEDSALDKLTAEKRELIARCRKLAGVSE